jgi:hypothetical protein
MENFAQNYQSAHAEDSEEIEARSQKQGASREQRTKKKKGTQKETCMPFYYVALAT